MKDGDQNEDGFHAVCAWLKAAKLITGSGNDFLYEESLLSVRETMDPAEFFQISRQCIVRLSAVGEICRTEARVMVCLKDLGVQFKVSRSRSAALKRALGKGRSNPHAITR